MTWITVDEAASLVNRPIRTIYRWAADGRIRTTRGLDGTTRIDSNHLIEVEPTIRPGRPRGTATTTRPINVLATMWQNRQRET